MISPICFQGPLYDGASIRVEQWDLNHFFDAMHFHEECQLTYVIDGKGSLFVGSTKHKFNSGDVYLFGKNLPHCFRNDEKYYRNNESLRVSAISIFFNMDSFRSLFEHISEGMAIENLFDYAPYGLRLDSNQSASLLSKIRKLVDMEEFDKVLELLCILDWISQSDDTQFLSSWEQRANEPDIQDIHRINEVINFIKSNYREKIKLDDIAGHFNMTSSTFCRFFKLRTKKTFSRFLVEFKIGKACSLLKAGTHNIIECCFDSGFTNVSNFHRHFKSITGMTPVQYKMHVTQFMT